MLHRKNGSELLKVFDKNPQTLSRVVFDYEFKLDEAQQIQLTKIDADTPHKSLVVYKTKPDTFKIAFLVGLNNNTVLLHPSVLNYRTTIKGTLSCPIDSVYIYTPMQCSCIESYNRDLNFCMWLFQYLPKMLHKKVPSILKNLDEHERFSEKVLDWSLEYLTSKMSLSNVDEYNKFLCKLFYTKIHESTDYYLL